MNPLVSDKSVEYQEKLQAAAAALKELDPHKRMGPAFAPYNRMGNTSSVIFPLLREHPENGRTQVLLQLRAVTEVWGMCWGMPASALNADENKQEVIERMLKALGLTLESAVELYGTEWYMSPDYSPWPDPHLDDNRNERGSYYHYPYAVVTNEEPQEGNGWKWWYTDELPDDESLVVHHVRGALFPALKYFENPGKYLLAIEHLRELRGY